MTMREKIPFPMNIILIIIIIAAFSHPAQGLEEKIGLGLTKAASISSPGEVDSYTFSGNTGDFIVVRIAKTGGDLWPRITLYDPSGKEMKRAYSSTMTEISSPLTAPGTYKMLVDDGYRGTYTGDYGLLVQRMNDPENYKSAEFGVSITGYLRQGGQVDTYAFSGVAGDTVVIRIAKTSGDLWPRITLYDPSGKELKRSYSSTTTELSSPLTASGIHTVLVDDGYRGTYTGEYGLLIQSLNDPKNVRPLEFGSSTPGSIRQGGQVDTYSFSGSPGDSVVIRIAKTSGDLWPRITLYDPSGKELKRSYSSTTTELSSLLTVSGTHTLLVDDGYRGTYTGDYSLFAQRSSTGEGSVTATPGIRKTIPVMQPSPTVSPGLNTPGGGVPMNYLVLGIIAVIIIAALFIGARARGSRKKPEKPGAIVPSIGAGIRKVTGHDVFISYSSEDKPIADAVCNNLEAQRIRCWVAPRDILPGMNFQESIIDAIDASSIMVLVFSSHSNDSPHVIREVTEAMSKGVIIIPFRIEDVLPSKSMKYLISVPHWLDAMTPPLEKHIEELSQTIRVIMNQKENKAKMEE